MIKLNVEKHSVPVRAAFGGPSKAAALLAGKHTMAHKENDEDRLGKVLWLLSKGSGFVSGTVVPVDGGFSAYSDV